MMRCFRRVMRVRLVLPLALGAAVASCGSNDATAVQERNGNRISIDYDTAKAGLEATLHKAEAYCRTQGDLHASQIDTAYLRGGSGSPLWRTATFVCVP
ncbi:hypothetical protein [Azospirillum fermentarium]|uniref:hypothetical protein n=1 Tax=Azospirillum fermentarium TaxID=1233114 RepID=UPI002227249E|nr:hypothetical protein [Azospirillum fermentarium]